MNHKNHVRAKVLTLIPIAVFAVAAACLVPLIVSYLSTGSDVTAVAVIIAGTLILIFTTLPCLVMSVAGTVFAAKAKNEGQTASRKFFVIGIVEIVVCSLGVAGAIAAAFLTILAAGR